MLPVVLFLCLEMSLFLSVHEHKQELIERRMAPFFFCLPRGRRGFALKS